MGLGKVNGDHPFTRRSIAALILAGGLVGAGWATGLGVLSRGIHPQLSVVGTQSWQVVLLEHGSARVVLLLGEFSESPDTPIETLSTSLRQHVDVVIGERPSLEQMNWAHHKWREATRIVMAESNITSITGRDVIPSGNLALTVGSFDVKIRQDSRGKWRTQGETSHEWHVSAAVGDSNITLANTIESANRYATESTALLMAPTLGSEQSVWSMGHRSIAINSDSVAFPGAGEVSSSGAWLVRTFKNEAAVIRLKDGRIALPEWAQPLNAETTSNEMS